MAFSGFGTGMTQFFDELAADNTRTWWLANKARYEAEVREPLELLLADLADEFGEAKVFRPNRDTRFSADKSPYKTQAAAAIGVTGGHASSLYVQVSADGLMLGGGCYHPARDQLVRLREAIAADGPGASFDKAVSAIEAAGGVVDARERLKTAPRGYRPDHPRIEYLRMKGLIGVVDHPPARWLHTAKAKDRVVAAWRALAPLNAWLESHVGPSTLPPGGRR
jgi:uncharacterized protein (TIGR02453 family)